MEKNKIVEQIKNKMDTEELHISRIPRNDRRWFIDYARDYFCNDYGMCLKHIIDTFRGMTPVGYEELQQQVDSLAGELNVLKYNILDKDEGKEKKMADGRVIKKR